MLNYTKYLHGFNEAVIIKNELRTFRLKSTFTFYNICKHRLVHHDSGTALPPDDLVFDWWNQSNQQRLPLHMAHLARNLDDFILTV